MRIKPPRTRAEKVTEVLHGMEIFDPFRWLEDKESAQVKDWMEEQNAYARGFLDNVEGREQLKNLFSELLNIDSFGSFRPRKRRALFPRWRYFQYRRTAGQNHYVLYYCDGLRSDPKIAIDPNEFSEDGTVAMAWDAPSRDGSLIAYGVTESGSDRIQIYVLDLDNDTLLEEKIPPVRYSSVAWLNDNSGFYYTKWPEPGAPQDEEDDFHVYFHELGTDPKEDVGLFGKGLDPKKYSGIYTSPSNKYLLITVWEGWDKSELFCKNLTKEDSEISPLVTGIDALFHAVIRKDKMYMMTNHGAPRFRIVTFDINKPQEDEWKEVIPEGKDTLEHFDIIGDKIVAKYLVSASSSLRLYSIDGRFLREIELPTMGSVAGPFGEWDGEEIFFSFSSFIIPPTIYRYDSAENKLEEIDQVKVDLDFDELELKQVWYESKDGTKVSMFIMHRKDIRSDGNNPTVLYGYGGFSISITPYFTYEIQPFLQKGGVYAAANLRGGGEYGEEWHRAGMLEKKQNVFDDFIAAAEWLIENRYTSKDKLAINGGSNGGLLVGACMTQRPDLFKAVICGVPVLDMIRYHKFDGGQLWIPEYGFAENKEEFEYLIKYSPYHNVRKGERYPAVLFMTADTDTRVHPMHAWKMAALLQKYNTSDNPIILRTETKAGHGFGKPVTKIVEEMTDKWSFLFRQLDMVQGAT